MEISPHRATRIMAIDSDPVILSQLKRVFKCLSAKVSNIELVTFGDLPSAQKDYLATFIAGNPYKMILLNSKILGTASQSQDYTGGSKFVREILIKRDDENSAEQKTGNLSFPQSVILLSSDAAQTIRQARDYAPEASLLPFNKDSSANLFLKADNIPVFPIPVTGWDHETRVDLKRLFTLLPFGQAFAHIKFEDLIKSPEPLTVRTPVADRKPVIVDREITEKALDWGYGLDCLRSNKPSGTPLLDAFHTVTYARKKENQSSTIEPVAPERSVSSAPTREERERFRNKISMEASRRAREPVNFAFG